VRVDPSTLPADHPSRNAPLGKVGGEYQNKFSISKDWKQVTTMKIGSVSYNGLVAIQNNPWIHNNHWRVEVPE
jgi:hypothetical protein